MRTWGIQSAKARENALILSPIVNSSNHRERARVLRLSLILVCFTLFCIGYRVCFWQDVPYAWQSSTMNGYNFHGRVHTKVKPARMVVLPATEVNSGFCRTLFTLLINGYPAPTIIGWGIKGKNSYNDFKVPTFNKWINSGGDDTDTILIIDAHDVYAQMPAEVFFDQFDAYPNSPGLVVGAEKNCHPGPLNGPRCSMLPKSPLPDDTYGDKTDKDQESSASIFGQIDGPKSGWTYGRLETRRPRYINSGTIVGTRQQLKKMSDYMLLYSRLAVSGAIRVAVKGDDQELLGLANVAHIFTENKTLVLPDMVSLLFQTITFSYKDLESRMLGDMLGTVRPAQQITLNRTLEEEWSNRIVIYNHLAKAIPSFIHFPGVKPRAKTEPYYHMLWFMQPSQRSDNVQASNDAPLTPAEGFLHHLDQHRNETFGYGARLDNGTWMGFMDMCAQHKATLLGLDMDWVTNPGGPYVEWGES